MRLARLIFTPTSKKRPSRSRRRMPLPPSEPRAKRKGVALIMVLVITTVLSALAADLENESQVNLKAAANARDEYQAYLHARSALELELFVLRFQSLLKNTIGQYLPVPLFELSGFLVSSDTVKGIVTRGETPSDDRLRRDDDLDSDAPLGDFHGSFWIEEVVDENRKININSDGFGVGCQNFLHLLLAAVFDDPAYDPVFETLGDTRDPIRNRIELIANITDWVDGNETVDPVCMITGDSSISGSSEDTRYNRLPYNATYKPKNGMMNSVAEMRLVPGVNDAFMRLFSRFFTVWSDTAGISMQTADPWMLRAVIRAISPGPPLPGDEEKFQEFMKERSMIMAMPPPLNKLSMPVFQQLLAAANIQYDPARLQELDRKKFIRFDDVSSVYRIKAVGRVNDASSQITVVWRDNRAQGEFYYWREE